MSVSIETIYSEVTTFERSLRKVWAGRFATVIPAERQKEIMKKAMSVLGDSSPEGMSNHIAIINDVLKEAEQHYDLKQFAAFWPQTAENKAVAEALERMGMDCLAVISSHAVRLNSSPRHKGPDELRP